MLIDEQVIQDALELDVEHFVKKYKPLNQDEPVSRTYFDLRNKHLKQEQLKEEDIPKGKMVTFAVIKRSKPSKQDQVHKPIASVSGESGKPKQTRTTEKGDKRNARIQELLNEGKSVKDIIAIMETEGFKVYAPQISNVRVAQKALVKVGMA